MIMKTEKIEEQDYFNTLELFDNNYELVIKCFKKFCKLRATPTVIRRTLSDIRFYNVGTKKRNYDAIKPAIEQLKKCDKDKLCDWIENNHIEEDFVTTVEVEKEILQQKKEDLSVLGFTEKQLEMICYREMATEEKYQEIIKKKEKKIEELQSKVNSKKNKSAKECKKERMKRSDRIYRIQKNGIPLTNFPKEYL